MNWSHNDLAVVEQALKQAIAGEADYQAIYAYQEVLDKMRSQRSAQSTTSTIGEPQADGFRYDYADSSNLQS